MVGTTTRLVAHRIRTLVHDSRDDIDLLERFHSERDSEAFDALVRRYGPMVMGICRRAIRDPHRAEDAFQATFLVLLKKSHIIRDGAVGPWLSGVARKVSLACLSRMPRERCVSQLPDRPTEADPPIDRDVLVLLDRELDCLPRIHREAVDLCELRGVSRSEAAQMLGIAEGTLSSRLAAARKTLHARLGRRGVAISAAGLGVIWSHRAVALAPSLFNRTLRIVDSSTPAAMSLAEGVLSMMTPSKLFTSKLAALAICLCVGFGIVAASDPEKLPGTKTVNDRPAVNDANRIVVLLTEDVRYFKTDGTCEKVFTYHDALKLESEMISGQIGFPFSITRLLSSIGRPGPDGSIVLSTKVGLKKFIPDPTPSIQRFDNRIVGRFNPTITAWSQDGFRFLSCTNDAELLTGTVSYQTSLCNFTTGETQLLPVSKEYELIDWCEATNTVLALKHKKDWNIFGSYLSPSCSLCLLSTEGKLIKELVQNDEFYPHEVRLSPDGKSVAYFGKSNVKNDRHWGLRVLDVETKTERVLDGAVSDREYLKPHHLRMLNQLAWSPDSSHVMLLKVRPTDKTKRISDLTATIYDRDGNGSQSVSLGQTKSDNFARHLEWQAVRSAH